jgi:Flp pilus assembly pilin Flp
MHIRKLAACLFTIPRISDLLQSRIADVVHRAILQARFLERDEEGKDAVEYSLLLLLLSLAVISILVTLGHAFGLLGGHNLGGHSVR